MGSVGRIKELLTKAVELDPKSFEARRDLIQFYLQAPGIAGGSVSKARELTQAAQSINPEHAKLLNAAIALYEKQPDEAEKLLSSSTIAPADPLHEHLDDAWISLGFSLMSAKAADKAKIIFQRMAKENPARANAYFYLGRAQLELKDWDAAIGSFKTAAQLDKSATYATDYRLGVAYQSKGDRAQAKGAFERAMAWSGGTAALRKEIEKRLRELS